jgi:Uma2 family endonuclease
MAVTHRLTTAEFLALCEQPENAHKRFELVNGVPVEMPPSSQRNTVIAIRIARLIGSHVDAHDLGYVTGADGGYELGPHDTRLPDVGYIAKARAGKLTGVTFPVAPDLAVEVISQSETSTMVRDKVKAYLDAGTRLVLAVYPDSQSIDAHRRGEHGQHSQTFGIENTIDAGDVLPGFSLKVADIFKGIE